MIPYKLRQGNDILNKITYKDILFFMSIIETRGSCRIQDEYDINYCKNKCLLFKSFFNRGIDSDGCNREIILPICKWILIQDKYKAEIFEAKLILMQIEDLNNLTYKDIT